MVGEADTQPHSVYRREGGAWLIEIRLRQLRQLFHHLDPAPFREKDLDPAAEEYIVEAVREIGSRRPCRLVVHMPPEECAQADAKTLPEAVHHYFLYRAQRASVERRQLLLRGTINLAIGLVFMTGCLWVRHWIGTRADHEMLTEGLLIIGWVALWRPIEIFLYDWWPSLRQQRRYEFLAAMPVAVVPERDPAPIRTSTTR